MLDKKIIKDKLNDRLKEIDKLVDELLPNDSINKLIKKYSDELKDYEYIDTVELFSTLSLRGSMKYINKYDKELRTGGLLVKIFKKDGSWYAIIKKISGKKYYISFNSNYIFYLENCKNGLRSWAQCFISDVDKDKYIIE